MKMARGTAAYLAMRLQLKAWLPRISPDMQHPAGAECIDFLDLGERSAPSSMVRPGENVSRPGLVPIRQHRAAPNGFSTPSG